MKFILVYEVNNREFANMELLKRELIRRGHTVKIKNKTESMVLSFKADAMLVPNSYNKQNLDNYRYIFNSNGNPVINYPCEQLIHRTLPNFYDKSPSNPVKKMHTLCWGDEYYDFICSEGNEKTRCYITGAIQLDYCRKEFYSMYLSKHELSVEYGIHENKKWILFISDFVYVDRSYTDFFINANVTSREILENEHQFQIKSQKEILSWFDQLLSTSEEYVIIYRKHPNEIISKDIIDFQRKHFDSFYQIGELSIRNWIVICDFILNYNSTSGAECAAAGKNNAIMRPYAFTNDIKFKEQEINKNSYRITNCQELLMYLEKSIDADLARDSISEYYSITDTPSFIRVADAIEKVAGESPTKPESNFFIKRWVYLFKKMVIPKILIKKIYKTLFIVFHFSESKSRSVGEWQKTAMNYKNEKKMAKQLDEIIIKHYS